MTSLYRTLSFTEVDSFALAIVEDLNFGDVYNLLSIKVSFRVRSGEKDRFIASSDMGTSCICFSVDRDRTNFQCFSRADYAYCDLASIRKQ